MPSINVEMMQQLLQEFTEKETLTSEEIKIIEQQVRELEVRITVCRDRLQNLNEDKDRLAAMKNRYVSGNNASLARLVSTENSGQPAKLADNVPTVSKNLSTPPSQTVFNEPEKNSLIEDLEPATTEESNQDQSENKPGANSDDAIKSINDALKGLFRK